MHEFVRSFPKFVNENYGYADKGLASFYEKNFQDFYFEEGIPELIKEIEDKWSNLYTKWKWNSHPRDQRVGHFSINAKLHIWPDSDKVKEIMRDPELTPDDIDRFWWEFMNEQREVLVDWIDFPWINDITFGGASGGWILVATKFDRDDVNEQIEAVCIDYVKNKEQYDDEDIERLKAFTNTEEFRGLLDVGIISDFAEIAPLKELADSARKNLEDLNDHADMIESNLTSIVEKINEFKKNGVAWFYEFLKEIMIARDEA